MERTRRRKKARRSPRPEPAKPVPPVERPDQFMTSLSKAIHGIVTAEVKKRVPLLLAGVIREAQKIHQSKI